MKTTAGSALTPIEPIITVIEITLLASIIVTVGSQIRRNLEKTDCVNNLRRHGVGRNLYLADQNGILPVYRPNIPYVICMIFLYTPTSPTSYERRSIRSHNGGYPGRIMLYKNKGNSFLC